MFWGITPALDLIQEYKNALEESSLPPELNILVLGGADCRHVLKTLARRYKHYQGEVKLNFYLMEASMETVAKQLQLLITALQTRKILGLEQKTKVFMELYGNTLIRPFTYRYLTNLSYDMIKMITNCDDLKTKIDFINLNLKHRELDYLENVIKFWCSKSEFNIVDIWDKRLRTKLGSRFDSKEGAFDWDLHMKLHSVGARQICDQEYRNFRLNGMAYSWLESEMSKPNRSLVCGVLPNGDSFAHYGYLGDMETGPFVTFGLECEDSTYLKSSNNQNSFRATDVIERNLKQIFYEIEHQNVYEHIKKHDLELGYAILKQDKLVVDMKPDKISPKKETVTNCLKIGNFSVKFLSLSILDRMHYKDEYWDSFDIIYFAHNYLKYFNESVVEKIAKDKCLIMIEHELFLVYKRKKDLEEYATSVREKVAGLNIKSNFQFNCEKDCYFKFLIGKNK